MPRARNASIIRASARTAAIACSDSLLNIGAFAPAISNSAPLAPPKISTPSETTPRDLSHTVMRARRTTGTLGWMLANSVFVGSSSCTIANRWR